MTLSLFETTPADTLPGVALPSIYEPIEPSEEPSSTSEPAFVDEAPVRAQGSFSLREHQSRAVQNVVQQFSKSNPERVKSTLVVHPTGTGKTFIMGDLARRANDVDVDCVWLIPAGPPIDELARAGMLAMSRLGRTAIREQADLDGLAHFMARREGGKGLTVIASAPTLRGARLERWARAFEGRKPPLILIDEAHFAPTKTIRDILEVFPRSRVVGFTATPDRADGQPLGEIFQSLADEYTLAQAIQDERIVQPLWCPIQTDPLIDLKNIRIADDGDFNAGDLEATILDNMERLVSEAKPAISGRKTLAFTPNIESAWSLCEGLKQVGVKAAFLASCDPHGTPFPVEKRREIIEHFEANRFDVLCNPILLSTGFDCPLVDCILNLRPTKSRARYTQIVGRALRLYPGKSHGLIVDFACDGHQLVTPVDLFDTSSISSEVSERAKELMRDGENNPQRALELAGEEHALDLRRHLQLRERQAQAVRRVYNPLETMNLLGIAPKTKEGSWYASTPADDRDKAFLNKIFNKKKQVVDVDALSYYAAKDMCRTVRKRMDKGLCSINQISLLVKLGMAPEAAAQVKFGEVNAKVAELEGGR